MNERKTVKDYLEQGEFRNEDGSPIWFISPKYGGAIYDIEASANVKAGTEKFVLIDFKSLHPYLGGIRGGSDISLHLNDFEATEEDHKRQAEQLRKAWEEMPFEKQKQHVQFAYDMGAEVPAQDITRYKIKTS